MGWMWISLLVFFGLLCAAGWLAIIGGSPAGPEDGESPEQILKRRYAAGEIDHETYERMLGDLRVSGGRK